MVADRGIKNINLYDIYANIVPGLAFLFGLAIPFNPRPFLNLVFGEDVNLTLSLSILLLVVVISFIIGQILQVFGGRFDGDHGFDNLMWNIRGKNVDQIRTL